MPGFIFGRIIEAVDGLSNLETAGDDVTNNELYCYLIACHEHNPVDDHRGI